VIRFSAGLVVVAIGVLIGGVATSKLSLVYVAIAVSALALVTLAIGVALKRDELFGGGPESAPAGVGADSGMLAGQSVGAGDVRGSAGHVREDQKPIQTKVPGPATAAFEAAAAASASVAAPTVTAPSMTTPTVASPTVSPAPDNSPFGNPPLAHRRTAFGSVAAPEGDAAADWQTRSPRPPWSSGDQVRPTWAPEEQPKASPPKAPQPGAAPVLPPRAWASPEQSSARTSPAGSGPAAPSWFDRLNQPVDDPAARTGTDPAKAEPEKAPEKADDTESITTSAAADASGVDTDDDDWPTRYSWLDDDEADETDETGDADKKPDVAEAGDTADVTDVTDIAETVAVKTVAPETVAPETVPAKTVTAEAVPEEAKAAATDAGSLDVAASPDADAEDHPLTADDAHPASGSAAVAAEPDETAAPEAAHEDEDEDEPPAPQGSGARLVTVIPGVPRYHDPDCILIRFMDDEDIARKSIPEAKAANCTPCAACQPEG
jgi:hypothetical protein